MTFTGLSSTTILNHSRKTRADSINCEELAATSADVDLEQPPVPPTPGDIIPLPGGNKILKALNDNGQANNTMVIFTSDHGEMFGNQWMFGKKGWWD